MNVDERSTFHRFFQQVLRGSYCFLYKWEVLFSVKSIVFGEKGCLFSDKGKIKVCWCDEEKTVHLQSLVLNNQTTLSALLHAFA